MVENVGPLFPSGRLLSSFFLSQSFLKRSVFDRNAVLVKWQILCLPVKGRSSTAVHIYELLSFASLLCSFKVVWMGNSFKIELGECSCQAYGDCFLALGSVVFVILVFGDESCIVE